MKRVLWACWVGLLGLGPLQAQNMELLYDFTEIPQALLLNPGARTDFNWYAGVPMLSGLSLQAGSSGITVHDIFADDGLDINDKVRERAVDGLSIRDEFTASVRMEVLSGGFRGKYHPENFYSFGIYMDANFISYWPGDLAELAWYGNANQLGRRFNLGHLKTRGELFQVFHFGLSRQVSRRLTLGGRAKLFSGIAHVNSARNSGFFVTNTGQNNLLAHTLSAQMRFQSSGLEALRQAADGDPGELPATFLGRAFLGGDLGLGFDAGFTYELTDQWVVTGSLLDVGFMLHSTDPKTFTLDGRATIEGVEIILPEALADPNRDFWQNLVDEVEALVPFEDNNKTYLSFRPTKLYGSVRYNFGEPVSNRPGEPCDCDITPGSTAAALSYRNALGAQVFAINRPRGPQAALTGFYLRRVGRWLAVKATYTADKYSLTNLGLGLQFRAGPVQLYLMGNNLLGYRNIADSHTASFQFGLNILSSGSN